jgi:hypothetical protein
MDILESIATKISALRENNKSPLEIPAGVKAVLTHIEVAENYFQRAKKENDMNSFTDVIYRTNHAFEGILKEAFIILADKEAESTSTYEIENYLTSNSVFKERVMELFKNYRQNWRNPSTHNHQLFFTEQEAFLAIVTVSAFVSILIDQIIQKISYSLAKARVESRVERIRNSIKNFETLESIDRLASILQEYSKDLQHDIEKIKGSSESQLIGDLSGFLVSIEPNLKINDSPPLFKNLDGYRPDLILELDQNTIVLEVKRTKTSPYIDDMERSVAESQLENYLRASKIQLGVLYYFPIRADDENTIWLSTGRKIRYIYPIDKEAYLALEEQAQRNSMFDDE